MGKEAKIGLSVIVVLVLCLGGVITKRIVWPSKPHQASTTEDPPAAKDKESKNVAKPETSAASGAKPTVVAVKPANGQTAKSSPLDVGHWNTAGDGKKRAAGDAATKSNAQSYMPKAPQPAEVAPNDRYATQYHPQHAGRAGEVGAAEVGAADAGTASASEGASEPYDPFQRYDARRGAAAGGKSEASALKIAAPGNSSSAKASTPAGQGYSARPVMNNKPSADPITQADAYAARYGVQGEYGAADSRYSATRGAAGYADGGYAAATQGSRAQPSYPQGAAGYTAARPSPGYGNPNRLDGRTDAGYAGGYASGYAGSYGGNYGVQRDPRRDDGTYEVQPNDTYWTISQKCYGTGSYFRALAEVNRKKIPQEDQLQVGALISAPDVAQLERQYPKLCPKSSRRETVKHSATPVSASGHLAGARTYTTQEGDTLYEIAKAELGKASRWVEIYELNREQLGPDYDYLPAGLHLALPGKESTDAVTRRPAQGPDFRYQR